MGRTCGEPDEIKLPATGVELNGSRRAGAGRVVGVVRVGDAGRGVAADVVELAQRLHVVELARHVPEPFNSTPMAGQFDFVWLSARTPHWAYVR